MKENLIGMRIFSGLQALVILFSVVLSFNSGLLFSESHHHHTEEEALDVCHNAVYHPELVSEETCSHPIHIERENKVFQIDQWVVSPFDVSSNELGQKTPVFESSYFIFNQTLFQKEKESPSNKGPPC